MSLFKRLDSFVRSGNFKNPAGFAKFANENYGPGAGATTAADGAEEAARQNREFSDTQWGRQMEGLAGAQGAYDRSQNYWDSQYGNQGSGQLENWWTQNQNKFSQPGRSGSQYDQFKTWASDPRNNATNSGMITAGQYMGGPSAMDTFNRQHGEGLTNYSGPQTGANQWNQYQPAFNTTGAGEDWFSQNKGAYNQAGNQQSIYDAYSSQLTGPSKSEGFQVNAPTFTGDNLQGLLNYSRQDTRGVQNEAENKGYVRDAGDVSNYYASQQGALQGPGQYEQFVTADINGTNPAYERTRQQGIAGINQEMARRGNFNSGGAMTAIGNYTGALDAADYENRANRAKSAQGMELSRIAQGTQSAAASSSNKLAQGQALQGIDVGNEAGGMARQRFGLDAMKQASDESLAGQELGLKAAGQGDSQQLARLAGLQNMGKGADDYRLQQLAQGQNAASDAQSQALARMMGGMNNANQLDQTRLASDQQGLERLMASFNMSKGADDYRMQQGKQFFDMGRLTDQSNMDRYKEMFTQATGADDFDLRQLIAGGTMAGGAQDAEQKRKLQAFAAQMGISEGQAQLFAQFYGQGGSLSGQAFSDSVNAGANAAQLRGQAQNAPWEMAGQLAGLGAQGYAAYQGGRRR
jgi:hypothetical protein